MRADPTHDDDRCEAAAGAAPLRAARKAAIAALLLAAVLGAASCARGRQPRAWGLGADFVELYPIAERTCDASVSGEVLGATVTVRYPSSLGETTARRFVAGLDRFQRERETDYQILRDGLRAHLGAALFGRVQDKDFLRARELETTWYLMEGEQPAHLMWRGPPDSRFHFLGPNADGEYPAEELVVHSNLAPEVHELTHWTVWSIVTSRRRCFPRWLEEGLCDYVGMQFQRWKDGRWDASRELQARLAWDRPAARARLTEWTTPNDGWLARRRDLHEPSWSSNLQYGGSLGLVFGLESELGSGGLLELIKHLLVESPETDEETVELIEAAVGKPIREVGRLEPAARQAVLDGLLDRAATACGGEPPPGALPLRALGHFVEAVDEVVPTLHSLTACEDEEVVEQGVAGLCYLGRPEALESLLAGSDPASRERIESVASWPTARDLLESRSAVARWFAAERQGESGDRRRLGD